MRGKNQGIRKKEPWFREGEPVCPGLLALIHCESECEAKDPPKHWRKNGKRCPESD